MPKATWHAHARAGRSLGCGCCRDRRRYQGQRSAPCHSLRTLRAGAGQRAELAAALEADGVDPATAKALAELPPPVVSTPDEVAARRAERRERIAREKADGTRRADGSKRKPAKEPKAKKATKADAILELVSRDGGESIPEICEATGWQRHTLRGYIAGTLRKRGHQIVCVSIAGTTGYRIDPPADHDTSIA